MSEYKKYFTPNLTAIGERIRRYRKEHPVSQEKLSQEKLIEKMSTKAKMGRNTLSKLENGDETAFSAVTMAQLDALCAALDCSIGYLLGEYSCRTYDIQFIHDKTGLPEDVIERLIFNKTHNQRYIEGLTFLLRSVNFENVLNHLTDYAMSVKEHEILSNQFEQERMDACIGDSTFNKEERIRKEEQSARRNMDVKEYHLDTDFRYTIQELKEKAKTSKK